MIDSVVKWDCAGGEVSIDGGKPMTMGGEKGGYFIQNLSAGEHEITFSLKAYQTVVKKLLILPDQTLELNIKLTPIEIEEASPSK